MRGGEERRDEERRGEKRDERRDDALVQPLEERGGEERWMR